MPWLVGIDEAGYGPNLGPFVMSLAAVHVPPEHAGANLWKLLSAITCRAGDSEEGRIVVDDSKKVYVPPGGLPRLERQVLPFVWHTPEHEVPLEWFWEQRCLTPLDQLRAEPWFTDGTRLPLHCPCSEMLPLQKRLGDVCSRLQIAFGPIAAVVVFPRQFNTLLEEQQSKAAAPAWALGQLLARLPLPRDETPTRVYVDKLGGRNHYQQILQTIFTECLVMSRGESARKSTYQVIGSQGNCEISFQPEADGRFFSVALASMLSKYLREVLMEQFNRFWQQHVPDLKPTAGYPGDAGRFYQEIRRARERLGIGDAVLWRAR